MVFAAALHPQQLEMGRDEMLFSAVMPHTLDAFTLDATLWEKVDGWLHHLILNLLNYVTSRLVVYPTNSRKKKASKHTNTM